MSAPVEPTGTDPDLFEVRPEAPRYVDPDLPLIPADSSTRPRRQPARRPPRRDWQPARSIHLRTRDGDGEQHRIDAAAFQHDWVTVRIDENGHTRIVTYPAWRVTEIEMRTA